MKRPQTPFGDRHRAALRFIHAYQRDHTGFSPSHREMGACLGIRAGDMTRSVLDVLTRDGFLIYQPYKGMLITPVGYAVIGVIVPTPHLPAMVPGSPPTSKKQAKPRRKAAPAMTGVAPV